MPVPLSRTKKGRLLAVPIKKVLPNGTMQLAGTPNSFKHERAKRMKGRRAILKELYGEVPKRRDVL